MCCFFVASCGSSDEKVIAAQEGQVTATADSASYVLGFCPDSLDVAEGKVRSGQFFSTLLAELGMSQKDAYKG